MRSKTWTSPIGPSSGLDPPWTTIRRPFAIEHATCALRGGGLAPAIGRRDHDQSSQSRTTTSLKHVPRVGSWPPKTYTFRPTAVAVAPER